MPSFNGSNGTDVAIAGGVEIVVFAIDRGSQRPVKTAKVGRPREFQFFDKDLHELLLKVLRFLPLDEANGGMIRRATKDIVLTGCRGRVAKPTGEAQVGTFGTDLATFNGQFGITGGDSGKP